MCACEHGLLCAASFPQGLPWPCPPPPRTTNQPPARSQPPQDEVGVRLTQVEPGAADWRAMNLLTQYYSRPRYL